jgi:hypothetical protein
MRRTNQETDIGRRSRKERSDKLQWTHIVEEREGIRKSETEEDLLCSKEIGRKEDVDRNSEHECSLAVRREEKRISPQREKEIHTYGKSVRKKATR